jgi:hypothetical protein
LDELIKDHYGDRILRILSRSESRKVGLLIRHSVKEKISDEDDARLSEIGHEEARRFGRLLPRNMNVSITYSSSPRCIDTATDIIQGFAQNGNGNIQNNGVEQFLAAFHFFSKDLNLMNSIKKTLGTKIFVREWLNETLKEDAVWSPRLVHSYLANYFHNELQGLPTTTLRIWISHDFSIALIRESLFGAKFEAEPWISYLDGVVLMIDSNNDLSANWKENSEPISELVTPSEPL